MKRIPEVVFEFPSSAERKLFELLGSVDAGRDWIAYHSLNLSEHAYKAWAEIDFLLVGPECALVLEVKGGRVAREDGVWIYTDRYGRDHRRTEGPFAQARTAMYALRDRLDSVALDFVRDRRLTFGWGVVFPDIEWGIDTPEHPVVVVADLLDVGDSARFSNFLRGLVEYWTGKNSRAETLESDELVRLRRKLRPDVDRYPPLTQRVGMVLDEMQALTDSQYDRMGVIEANDRVLVTGGAGTGKTFLAIQAARRELARDRRVLLVMVSPVLRAWIRRLEPDRRLDVVTFAELRERPEDTVWDVLFVDEGQDLTNLDALAILSERLEGGMEAGRWRWFMDDNRQAGLTGRFDPAARDYLANALGGGGVVNVPLVENVRNTVEVSNTVREWTGAEMGSSSVAGHGRRPQIAIAETREAQVTALGSLLDSLLEEGAEPEEIGIVHARDFDADAFLAMDRRLRRRLVRLDSTTAHATLRGRIAFGDAAAFKGLERPIVVCIGFASEANVEPTDAEFYVAVSRPNYGLYLITDKRFASSII